MPSRPRQLIGDHPSLVLKVKRRQTASKSVVFQGDRSTEYRHDSVAGEIDSAPYALDDVRERLNSSLIASRKRSVPSAEAMSIDRTTSANRTVTCLNSAACGDGAIAEPHESQNRAP